MLRFASFRGRPFKAVFLAAISLFSLPGLTGAVENRDPIIRLATTTSTENSGLLKYLLPRFEETTGYRVHVIAVGTGKALRMGRDGDVDIVLVHAPSSEQASKSDPSPS